MSASLTLIAVMAVMYAVGVFMLLERSMTRVLLGFLLVSNATNLLILIVSGRAGVAPFFGQEGQQADPLPQAFILTSIVITFGISAFLMALIYRSWRLASVDVVYDDSEDIEVGRRRSSMTAEREVIGEETEFGIRATAAVRDALDLAELERLEDKESIAEQLKTEELTIARSLAERDDSALTDMAQSDDAQRGTAQSDTVHNDAGQEADK